jgi:hypothetical protein
MPKAAARPAQPAVTADPVTEAPIDTASGTTLVKTKSRSARSRSSRAAARAAIPVALGSLTQPGARQGACCQVCGSARVTSLTLTLTDGTPVEFTSCHNCEHRSWFSPMGELDRATVLDKTRKIR